MEYESSEVRLKNGGKPALSIYGAYLCNVVARSAKCVHRCLGAVKVSWLCHSGEDGVHHSTVGSAGIAYNALHYTSNLVAKLDTS